jgi:predicted kinase
MKNPKILLLNGVTSSGKTTVSQQLSKLDGFVHINKDHVIDNIIYGLFEKYAPNVILNAKKLNISDQDIKNIICGRSKKSFVLRLPDKKQRLFEELLFLTESFLNEVQKPSIHYIYEEIQREATSAITNGRSVVIDAVMLDPERIKTLKNIFDPIPIVTVLLYSPLQKNLRKCFARNFKAHINLEHNFRMPAWVMEQFILLYSCFELEESLGNLRNPKALDIIDNTKKSEIFNMINFSIKHTLDVLEHTHYETITTREKEIEEIHKFAHKTRILTGLDSSFPLIVQSNIKHDYYIKY